MKRSQIIGGLALGMLALIFLRSQPWDGMGGGGSRVCSLPAAKLRAWLPAGRSACDMARWEAWAAHNRAQQRVNEELDGIEAWDPCAHTDMNRERWRRQFMARDAGGNLRSARTAALRAAALARTTDEAYQTAELLVRIECDRGDHRAELAHAQCLARLKPRTPESYMVLEHAASCSGRRELARQARAMLSRLEHTREFSAGQPPGTP